jgi:hypothetical protein
VLYNDGHVDMKRMGPRVGITAQFGDLWAVNFNTTTSIVTYYIDMPPKLR